MDVRSSLNTQFVVRLTSIRFQEVVLSKRIIVFINQQVYFRCPTATFSEEIASPFPLVHSEYGADIHKMCTSETHPQKLYDMYHLRYSGRKLTHESDILNPIAGLLCRLSVRMKCQLFQGLPTAAFDKYIIFRRGSSLLKRRPKFPSYSWTGWIGTVEWDPYDLDFFMRIWTTIGLHTLRG
jgi:hypothetical protein